MPIWNPLDENPMTDREKSIAAVLDGWTHEQWQEFNRAYGMSCPLGKLTRLLSGIDHLGVVGGEIRWKGEDVLSPGDLGMLFRQVVDMGERLSSDFIQIHAPMQIED